MVGWGGRGGGRDDGWVREGWVGPHYSSHQQEGAQSGSAVVRLRLSAARMEECDLLTASGPLMDVPALNGPFVSVS